MKRLPIRRIFTWLNLRKVYGSGHTEVVAMRDATLLADEPTAALDGTLVRQVMELFAKIAHEHQAGVIVVTHDHLTLDVFDRILDVEDGTIRIRPTIQQAES